MVKRFATTCALDSVDLILHEGEVRGLLGPNGAGKTTLLRILFGLIRTDDGSVALLEREPGAANLAGVAGFVEDPTFYPYLTGRANLELLAELDGRPSEAPVDEVLDRVGLRSRAGDRTGGYSSGMKQRLGIAAALLRRPQLLLLDEPTAGLDPRGVKEVGALVGELAGQGVAVLLSSHQISEVEGVCDTFTVLRRGKVVWDGTAAELSAQAPASAYAIATSDDFRAAQIAAGQDGVRAAKWRQGGLALTVAEDALDPYVLALGQAGVAIRRLEQLVSPLESMFFALTSEDEAEPLGPAEIADRVLTRA